MQNTLAKITMLSLVSALTLTACDKKTDSTDNAAAASVAESQAVPMSAAPADEKNSAAVTEANATVDAGPDATNASGTAATTVDPRVGAATAPHSTPEVAAPGIGPCGTT